MERLFLNIVFLYNFTYLSNVVGFNNILLINRHIQHDKDIYDTGSDRKLKAYINQLLRLKCTYCHIGVGRFRILGGWGGGGQGLEYWGDQGDQIPSRHMTSY